jgi:hypothetical protein
MAVLNPAVVVQQHDEEGKFIQKMAERQLISRNTIFWILSLIVSLLCGVDMGWRLGHPQHQQPLGMTSTNIISLTSLRLTPFFRYNTG